jgi:hypothetical protein
LLVPLALAVSGCLSGSASTNPHTQPTGRLVGSMVTDGGVALPSADGSQINPVKNAPILVTGTTTDGRHIQRGPTTDEDGRFIIQVPAGNYKVENGIYLNVTGSAVVAAGKTSHVRLVVHVM